MMAMKHCEPLYLMTIANDGAVMPLADEVLLCPSSTAFGLAQREADSPSFRQRLTLCSIAQVDAVLFHLEGEIKDARSTTHANLPVWEVYCQRPASLRPCIDPCYISDHRPRRTWQVLLLWLSR